MAYIPTAPALDQPYPGVPFNEAWRRFWKKGVTFSGRASRSEYWKLALLNIVLVFVFYLLEFIGLRGGSGGFAVFITVIFWLYVLAAAVPGIALGFRRLHDANYSGGMYFLALIPFVGGFIVLILTAQPSNPLGARFDVPSSGGYPYAPMPGAAFPPPPPPAAPAPQAFGAAPVVPPAPPASAASLPPIPPAPPSTLIAQVPIVSSVPLTAAPVASVQGSSAYSGLAEEVEATRISAPAVRSPWSVSLPDGRVFPIAGALLLGRDPSAEASHAGAILVPIDDPAKSMSKTHARLELAEGGPVVTDLHSTNGTTVTTAGGTATSLAPGVGHRVDAGAVISLGDYRITVTGA